jgi:glycine cleavage system H lipoate-binding protein
MKEERCPFLELKTVTYCKAFPVKMIPLDRMSSSKGLCNTVDFQECSLYREVSAPGRSIETVRGFLLKSDCYYHPRHIWVSIPPETGNVVKIGIDDFARRLIGQVDRVAVPAEGAPVKENRTCFLLHAGGRMARIASPVDGAVKAVNPKVASDPSAIGHDAYGDGWLVSVELAGEGIKGLFYGSNARKWLECEIERLQRAFALDLGITAADGGEALPDISNRLNDAQWSRIVAQFLG